MATALRLHTREARKKLPVRSDPYWHELRRGLHLGYRHGASGGSWLLREFNARAGKDGQGGYVKRRLGAADDVLSADGMHVLSWTDACATALGTDRPTITKPARLTVAEAADAYFSTRTSINSHDRLTWARFIEPKLGSRSVAELTTGDLEKWLSHQVPSTDDKEVLRAARATANRRWTVLRAILNSAFRKDPARVPSAEAWRRVRSFQRVDRPRTRTLSVAEARKLLNALPEPLKTMARGALETGLRLGELEALRAADVGRDFVRVRNSKSGKPRTVPLTGEGAAFFSSLVTDKAPDAPVFDFVSRINVSRQMRAACVAADIDPPAVFHDLRRSYGSLLLNSGASSDAIQELLGHADLRMTRRAYAHIADVTLHRAVKKLPSFTAESPKSRPRSV